MGHPRVVVLCRIGAMDVWATRPHDNPDEFFKEAKKETDDRKNGNLKDHDSYPVEQTAIDFQKSRPRKKAIPTRAERKQEKGATAAKRSEKGHTGGTPMNAPRLASVCVMLVIVS